MIDVKEKKKKIISFLETNGPSLPVRIARAIEMDPVFASAILSEILDTKEIKMSNIKIGASGLYLLPGQEQRLEEHIENLKPTERDAYTKLKENKIINDEDEEPAIRVALRNIKDFATPLKFKNKIIWKYAFTPNEEIQSILNPKKKQAEPETLPAKRSTSEAIYPLPVEGDLTEDNLAEDDLAEEEVPKAWEAKKQEIQEAKASSEVLAQEKQRDGKESKKVENIFTSDEEQDEPEFFVEVKNFLENKNIEILEQIQINKKEIVAKVNIETTVGNMRFLLIAKNKKTITIDEINSALQRTIHSKMPCLYIIRREPTKKIQTFLESNSLIKLEILK